MRRVHFFAAASLTLVLAAHSLGQGGGMGGTGGGGTSFSGGGTSLSGGGTSLSGGGTSLSGGSNSFTGGTNSSIFGTTTVPGRTGAGGRTSGGTGAVQISPTNFLSATYSNPLYTGRPGSSNISPLSGGGFGQPSFGATTTGGTGRTATGTTAGRTQGGLATVNNGAATAAVQNIVPITFTTVVRFPAPPIQSSRVQADLQGLISRTSALRQPGNVRVEVEGTTVILRGRVADDDERRLAEGMVRLEPGVREVRNELTIP